MEYIIGAHLACAAALFVMVFGNFLYTIIWLPRPPTQPNFDSGGIPHWEIIDRKLIDSAKAGNYDDAEKSLDAGADVRAYSNSALIYACAYGHPKIVRLLLKNGANIHIGNDFLFQFTKDRGHAEVTAVLNEYVASENPTKGE